MRLSERDRQRLVGVHPDLVRVVERAAQAEEAAFIVLEGLRSMERQAQLAAAGRSQTMRSRHLTGHAVDLGALGEGGKLVWTRPAYYALGALVKAAAKDEGVPVEWGGDWRGFFDGPHFQLPWADYPA